MQVGRLLLKRRLGARGSMHACLVCLIRSLRSFDVSGMVSSGFSFVLFESIHLSRPHSHPFGRCDCIVTLTIVSTGYYLYPSIRMRSAAKSGFFCRFFSCCCSGCCSWITCSMIVYLRNLCITWSLFLFSSAQFNSTFLLLSRDLAYSAPWAFILSLTKWGHWLCATGKLARDNLKRSDCDSTRSWGLLGCSEIAGRRILQLRPTRLREAEAELSLVHMRDTVILIHSLFFDDF